MKYYRTKHLIEYEEPKEIGWTSMDVLPFLIGLKWDQMALNYVNAVRPSSIRVTTNEQTLDARAWRVTVLVDESDTILSISQEVEVGCVGFDHGHDMDEHLKKTLTRFD